MEQTETTKMMSGANGWKGDRKQNGIWGAKKRESFNASYAAFGLLLPLLLSNVNAKEHKRSRCHRHPLSLHHRVFSLHGRHTLAPLVASTLLLLSLVHLVCCCCGPFSFFLSTTITTHQEDSSRMSTASFSASRQKSKR